MAALRTTPRKPSRGKAHERPQRLSAMEQAMRPATTVIPEDGAPPLPRSPAALARRFQQVGATMVAQAIAGEDVVQLEYGSLIALEIEPGIDQRRLADAMGIDPSNAGHIVDRLQSMQLIERRIRTVPIGVRANSISRRKARRFWRRLRVKTSVANTQVLAPLAPHEREVFLDLLVRVIQGNWADARPGGGRRKRSISTSSSSKK